MTSEDTAPVALSTLRANAAVTVRGLVVRFGEVEAVAGIDLTAGSGLATALLGRNGAGKSTTMRVLAGLVPPTAGEVTVAGHPVADAIGVRRATGYCPDIGGLVPRATPWEHLQLAARLRRLGRGWEGRARDLLERFELGSVSHRVTGGFSHGMGRRMSVLLAAFHEPQVLLLDEPFDGVDPVGVDATMTTIAEATGRGTCVVLSTHLRELAVQACDVAVVLRGGAAAEPMAVAALSGSEGAENYRRLLTAT
ncbi:ABC transporter ATP-binding protein [Nocardioides limicola]|uniref:ABC transporter ATP-binding protein n=1 Tax=Nocardioides limicola TaxID=2803368 RepID=UPI0027DE01F5|nr:ABC transporter ATP-binding protein [Nocardioides sp. DJM-14]